VILASPADGDQGARVGFTVTKKIGSAVVRNRLKRRLRAAVHQILPAVARVGVDYILIGRHEGLTRPFQALKDDLAQGIARAHKQLDKRTEQQG
jgi:ribonuclease P protein component